VGHRSLAILGFAALAALAIAGCDDEYALPPTPCDDYCFAKQRADCEEDWPDECVQQCELSASPIKNPDCADEFDTLLACYQGLDDDDFECVDEASEPRLDLCEDEVRAHKFCLAPVYYRCLELCETRVEHCEDYGVDVRSNCLSGCSGVPYWCESVAVARLDCELADELACPVSPNCAALSGELSDCLRAPH
jgi:hypothetical protein